MQPPYYRTNPSDGHLHMYLQGIVHVSSGCRILGLRPVDTTPELGFPE